MSGRARFIDERRRMVLTDTQLRNASDKARVARRVRTTYRRMALRFWFGHLNPVTANLPVVVEMSPFDPFNSSPWPVPDLSRLPEGAAGVFRNSEILRGPIPRVSRSRRVLRYVDQSFERRFIHMTGDFEDYMAKFSGKTRSTLRRKQRKFEEASRGRIDWRTYRTPDEIVEFHALARQVSRLTYQEKLFDAGIPDDGKFVAEMQDRARRDAVRAFVLFLDGKPVSYLYCPIGDGVVTYGYLGFEPGCGHLSPGTVLQLLALEQLYAERRYRIFDFTEGQGDHKTLFSTGSVPCANIFYLRPTLANLAIVYSHWLLARLSNRAVSLVDRLGLRTRLRRLVRDQSAPKPPAVAGS
jgi:hypothetical protein